MEHLKIKPESDVTAELSENTLIISPDEPWPSGATIEIQLQPGAQSSSWIPLTLREGQAWSFTIRQPGLICLYPAEGPANIYSLNPMSGEQIALTSYPGGIEDYSVNPNGTAIYYSLREGTSGSAIYRLDLIQDEENGASQQNDTKQNQSSPELIYSCQLALCRSPAVSPNGDYLAFERTAFPGSNDPNYPQVWLLELKQQALEETEQAPINSSEPVLAGDPLNQTLQPTWSSKGLLAFYDTNASAFIFINPVNGSKIEFPNQTGQAGTWHPDGMHFVAPEIMFLETSEALDDLEQLASSHLIVFSTLDGGVQDLTPGEELEDTAPKFSPDGNSLVFARKFLDIERWTPGRQIWITDIGDQNAQPLTNEPLYNHFEFVWSPSGDQIAYVRFNQSTLTEPPEIWLLDPGNSLTTRLITGGYSPQWIP